MTAKLLGFIGATIVGAIGWWIGSGGRIPWSVRSCL